MIDVEELCVRHGWGSWSGPYGQFELEPRAAAVILAAVAVLGFVWLAPTGGLR